jgi:hypothetical protein
MSRCCGQSKEEIFVCSFTSLCNTKLAHNISYIISSSSDPQNDKINQNQQNQQLHQTQKSVGILSNW